MPNMLETGAAYLSDALNQHAGVSCVYRRGMDVFDVTLRHGRVDNLRDRNWLLDDKELSARGEYFTGRRTDFVLGEVYITPEPLDEIEWTDESGEPRISVVFPLVAEHCFRYPDPSQTLLRIYTVDQNSLSQVVFLMPDNNEFTVHGIVSRIAGRQFTTDLMNELKVLQTTCYLDRGLLEANGVMSLPMWAKVTAHGIEGWAVNLSESEWGAERVKLSLEQEQLSREYQARRNAAV